MLTACFTARHFDKQEYFELSLNEKVKGGVKYTICKFKKFLPYTTLPIFLAYWIANKKILATQGVIEFLRAFENMPFEMVYLSAGNEAGTKLFPLWFISAMLIVFPLFTILVQMRCNNLVALISAYAVLFYYLSKYDYGSHIYPNQMVRALCSMMMGYIVYEVAQYLSRLEMRKTTRVVISIAECTAALFPIVLSIWNIVLLRIYLVCFIIFLVTTFSGKSYVPDFSNRILIFLGKLSMPIYIWHYVIGIIINGQVKSCIGMKIALYYVITIIVAMLNMYIVDKVSLRKKSWNLKR